MNISAWAIKWGIPHSAVADLNVQFGLVDTDAPLHDGTSEAAVQSQVRLRASTEGCRLWRNNVGAYVDERGNYIRYGLCNDSAKMNSIVKSSDLVGIKPVSIEQHHVGTTIGQFMAREVKRGGWQYGGTPSEKAQLKFLELVTSMGGDAKFVSF